MRGDEGPLFASGDSFPPRGALERRFSMDSTLCFIVHFMTQFLKLRPAGRASKPPPTGEVAQRANWVGEGIQREKRKSFKGPLVQRGLSAC